MNYLLKILDISGADIARHAGITRQAVNQGSERAEHSARILVESARLSPDQMEKIHEAYAEIVKFLNNEI